MTTDEIKALIRKLESLSPTTDIIHRLELLRAKLTELQPA